MSGFWAAKLAGQDPPPLTEQPAAWWAGDGARTPAEPLPPTVVHTRVPESSRDASRCPECSSSNYMRPAPNAAQRCFDCGYPIVQSTSGVGISHGTPVGKPVRQVTGSGFHPREIIARLG